MSSPEKRKSELFQRLAKKADSELEAIQTDHLRAKQAVYEAERSLRQIADIIADAEQALRNAAKTPAQIPLETVSAIREYMHENKSNYSKKKLEQIRVQRFVDQLNKALVEKLLQRKGYERLMYKHKQKLLEKNTIRALHETEFLWLCRQGGYYE